MASHRGEVLAEWPDDLSDLDGNPWLGPHRHVGFRAREIVMNERPKSIYEHVFISVL